MKVFVNKLVLLLPRIKDKLNKNSIINLLIIIGKVYSGQKVGNFKLIHMKCMKLDVGKYRKIISWALYTIQLKIFPKKLGRNRQKNVGIRDLATVGSPPLTLGARHSATISVLAPGTQSVITCHFVQKIGLVSVNFAILVQNSQMHKVVLQLPPGTENLLARTCYRLPNVT